MTAILVVMIVAGVSIPDVSQVKRSDREIEVAARSCGTSVKIRKLPEDVRARFPQLGDTSIQLSPGATTHQRQCFARKIPMAQVGFISEPPTSQQSK